MLSGVFYWLLNMSIIATLVGTVVLVIRAVKIIPRRVSVFLWLVPFFRLSVPMTLSSPCSIMQLLRERAIKTVTVYESSVLPQSHVCQTNMIQAVENYTFPITYKVDLLADVFKWVSIVWAVVFAAILLTLLLLYIFTLAEIKDASPIRGNIYYSDKVNVPAVYGILRPKIILPEGFEENGLVLLHEQTHIRRGDNLWRALAFVITAAHWFNPFAWVFLKYLLADIELACDEGVLKRAGKDRVKEYAVMLLNSKESANVFVSAFGGARVRTRIENILSFKRLTVFSSVGLTAFVAAVYVVLMTNAT